MKATEVFTPGKFPVHTFVDDHLQDKKQQLLDTLDAGAMLISISGPSKSGKTVFIEECLGRTSLIQVTGAGVNAPSDLWMRVFDIIGTEIPNSIARSSGASGTVGGKGAVEGNALVVKGKGEVSASRTNSESETLSASHASDCLQLLIKELGGTDLVVFIDDFHYVPANVQIELAHQIKEAIRNGVRFVCASVPYHADDVIRSNPDLRGRVLSIDFEYWGTETLKKIAYKGFAELGVGYRQSAIDNLASEAAGSPQLMQYLCLNACYEMGLREKSETEFELLSDPQIHENICRRTVQSTDYGSVVELMKEGPRTRGSDRNVYVTRFGWNGDVYRLLVKALSVDPSQLTFRYNALNQRILGICPTGGPSGSSITSACAHSAKIVNDAAGSRIVEWDGEHDVFDIRDPYFLFYLRWSDAADS
ncbi:ATP-binding protein [Thiopseudomonas denitrificans]|uniref:AAA ATPase-like protein n=1 Tax=Thiopseudomonas denitrificans TaxID=1501432 RepID=A0A4R6TRB9_9GAMM|nr:ATP-binding protein [Thiopseudomonas denitrificans]TDQ34800.1 hypothetical protein DFQ45_11749 [Thiopseudomonas denitrificans]